ncbi:MAG: competence protein ComEC [Chthoniobacter sp.]|jgi:ComEC/Rec2-related protein|nr:competence protein ComEC [Chthoniobacter sp.]
MTLPELRPRQPFAGLAIAATLGIVAADRWSVPPLYVIAVLAPAAALLLWRPRTIACWIFTALAFFGLHTLRFHGHAARELARSFAEGPRVIRATGVVWSEPEKPAFWAHNLSCFFRLKLEALEPADSVRAEGVIMNVSWAGAVPAYGDRVTLTGSVQNLEPTRNPGQFDFTRHLQRQGIYSEIKVRFPEDGVVVSRGHGLRMQAFANAARHWIQSRLALDLEDSPEITALIESMVLGMRGDTAADTKELFQRTGTLHLFAVSGLNVAMLAAIALVLLKFLRVTGGPAVAVTLPVLAFYALVTGLSASCVRATIMGALILLGPVFDRRAVPYNSIFAAACLILAWDTNELFSPGFQFSFVLVLTILFLAFRIQRWFEPLGTPDPFLPRLLWSWPQSVGAAGWRLVAAALGVTLSAWVGSLAFTAGYFHLFSPAAIVANLLAVPIAFAVLALGVATLLTAGFWKTGALLFNNANWLAAKALLAVVRIFADVPGGHIYVELPHLSRAPACELTVLDVGDGGAIHLRARGRDWLLDCGSAHDYDRIILPYLRTRGVNQLDGLVITHGDSHHLGGVFSALDDFHPRCLAESVLRDHSSTRARLHAELVRRSLGKCLCEVGDSLHLSQTASLRVLFPPGGLKRSAADDKALVVQLACAGTRVLLMSDSGFPTEQWLLENEPDLRSDLLIKGQHGKDLSGTPDFLARVHPQAVICARLEPGSSAPPLDDWERDAAARGIIVFRQDRTGAVQVDLRDDGAFEVRALVGGQILRSRAR